MIDRVVVLLLAGCALFGSVIFAELTSEDAGASARAPIAMQSEPASPPRAQGPHIDELLATIVGRPLFSPTRQPAGRATSDQPIDLDLAEVRLTGIVMDPDRRIAIFAVPGAKPMVRSEGETMKDWRLDSITPREVVLSGPGGTRTLQPKVDTTLTRRPPAQAAAAARPAPNPQAAQSGGPGNAARQPPGAAPLKPASVPAVRPPGTPTPPIRLPVPPRERQ
jgi:hypothetical protein